jgi:heat shock protein HspQ
MSHRPNLIQRVFRLFFPAKKPRVEKPVARPEGHLHNAIPTRQAKYQIGQVVRHRLFDFRGVVFDVDPVFANSEEWYEAIPEEVRPAKDQPYYHLFAENERTHYVAYVSEQNLEPDESNMLVTHPDIPTMFERTEAGYVLKAHQRN